MKQITVWNQRSVKNCSILVIFSALTFLWTPTHFKRKYNTTTIVGQRSQQQSLLSGHSPVARKTTSICARDMLETKLPPLPRVSSTDTVKQRFAVGRCGGKLGECVWRSPFAQVMGRAVSCTLPVCSHYNGQVWKLC